jgi:hypothetical protein
MPPPISVHDSVYIRTVATFRQVNAVYHFTRCESLESICQKGLLSQAELERQAVKCAINDDRRLDGHRDAISLSVSFPNYKLFYKFRCDGTCKWALIELDPAVLWELNCAFYPTNAARASMAKLSPKEQMNGPAFAAMFSDLDLGGRERSYVIDDCDTTDPQAEVLVFDPIEPSRIKRVHFHDQASMFEHAAAVSKFTPAVTPWLFQRRRDWSRWRSH